MASSIVGAYVRIAEPHEYSEAAWIFTRGFARDPCMNWFGGVKEMVPAYKDEPTHGAHPATAAANRTLKNLHAFQSAIIKSTILCGGYMTVAVIPKQRTSVETGKESSGELIVGATLWLKPGQTLDLPLSTVIRSGLCKVLRGWGLGGVKVPAFFFLSVFLPSREISHSNLTREFWSTFQSQWKRSWKRRLQRGIWIG